MEKNVERLLRGGQFVQLIDQQGADIRKKYDLKKVELKILYYLSDNSENNTARDIQLYFNINKGYISQAVDRLRRRGFLTAVPDENDRRYVHYTVTDKTTDILNEIAHMWEVINSHIFRGVTEEEQETLRRIACKIEQNILNMLNV